MNFSFQKRKEELPPSPFVLTDDRVLDRLRSTKEIDAFEESLLDPEPVLEQPVNRFLGLTITARRFRVGFVCLLIVFAVFLGRAGQLQIMEGEYFREVAEGNRFRTEVLPAARGVVTDRTGAVLIENVPAFTLTMTIAELPDPGPEREAVFARVADLAGLQRTDIDLLLQEFAKTPFEPIVIRKDVDYANALLLMIEEPVLPGFDLEVRTKRQYASIAPSLSHVLGYMGKMSEAEYEALAASGYRRTDEIGKTGVEKSLESLLRGIPGRKLVEVDAFGEDTVTFAKEEPRPGSSIALSIDFDLQTVLETRIQEALDASGASRASAVAMDPRDGKVLALVSLPTYDSNVFAGGIDAETYENLAENGDQPLFPRAIAGEFPSGSTFKPYVAAAALAEGIINASTSFLSVGGISIGPWFFPDWKAGGHGVTDVRRAIAESVNTFFYIIGGGLDPFVGLGVERITDYARLFGFGAETGINLPGEADGFLPSKEWKEDTKGERWYVGDTYHLAIGQGDLLVTPIQMAVALSAIANGGTRWAPSVVWSVDDVFLTSESTEIPEEVRDILHVVREGMRQTVTIGSARSLSDLPIAVAGKTGTAQTIGDRPTHAWFTGFAPYDEPEIAIVILIEEGGEGSSVAVPIARDIFVWWAANR